MVLWIFLTLASALTIGIRDVLVKKIFKNKDTSPTQIVFEEYLMLFAVVLLIFFPRVDFLSYKTYWDLYLIKTLTLLGFTMIYFSLLKKYEISSISPLVNLSPIFLLFLSGIFLGEIINMIQFLGIMLIIFSTYILEINFHHNKRKDPHKQHFEFLKKLDAKVIFWTILMLILISITAIADRLILKDVGVYTNMFFTGVLIFIFLLFYNLKERRLKTAFSNIIGEPQTLIIAVFMVISTFLILMAISIPSAMLSLIIPLKRTSTLFASILGGVLFHEKNLMRKGVATIGMLFGVLLIAL